MTRGGPRLWRRLLRLAVIEASEQHAAVDVASVINVLLDAIPRTRFYWSGRPQPAFRVCGAVGLAVGLAVALAAGLLGRRSLAALGLAAGAAMLSFFAWARLRRAVMKKERLVLLEHVWVALAAVSAVLAACRMPVLATLDAFCAGLAFFLAAGRAGCLLVGCCHGYPTAAGIRYPESHVRDGFPAYLAGIRLFPVQLLELAGLCAIGVTALAAVLLSAPGTACAWFLVAYALLRFALEELRGDERPHWLEMSVPRWMCLAEGCGVAAAGLGASGLPAIAVAVGTALYFGRKPARRLLDTAHVAELRALLRTPVAAAQSTTRRATLAVSRGGQRNGWHVSLGLPLLADEAWLACRLAARAFPHLETGGAVYSEGNVLHFRLVRLDPPSGTDERDTFRRLYRTVVLHRQAPGPGAHRPSTPVSASLAAAPWYWKVRA
ncbi:MAG: prolipoprotein diacylglyceryl transferase [Bryobacterales bacterium]|nr:prolipoprotein diacylglyceryl transferase [Bryobacterales bacterium]